MTDKSNVPLLAAEDVLDLSPFGLGLIKAKLNAIANKDAIVISAADLNALRVYVETLEARERVHLGQIESLRTSQKTNVV